MYELLPNGSCCCLGWLLPLGLLAAASSPSRALFWDALSAAAGCLRGPLAVVGPADAPAALEDPAGLPLVPGLLVPVTTHLLA